MSSSRSFGVTSTGATDAAIAAHEADTTNVHGITDTAVLETVTGAQTKATTAQTAATTAAATDATTKANAAQAAAIAASVQLTGDQTVAGIKTFSSEPVAPSVKVTGTTGAANQGRFVGVTTSGAPTSGTYSIGDYCLTQNGQLFACTVAGTPGTWVNPRDTSNLLTSGEETISRELMTSNNIGPSTGQLRLAYFTARKTETSTQCRYIAGTTAAAATPTLCRIGIYEIASNGDGTLVASTTNDTTLFATASATYTRSWSVSFTKTAGKRYAMGPLVVTGAATPTFMGCLISSGGEAGSIAPVLSAAISSLADLPAGFVAATPTASGHRYYGVVLP